MIVMRFIKAEKTCYRKDICLRIQLVKQGGMTTFLASKCLTENEVEGWLTYVFGNGGRGVLYTGTRPQ